MSKQENLRKRERKKKEEKERLEIEIGNGFRSGLAEEHTSNTTRTIHMQNHIGLLPQTCSNIRTTVFVVQA